MSYISKLKHLGRHVSMYNVILAFSFKDCQHVHYENIQDATSIFIWHRKSGYPSNVGKPSFMHDMHVILYQ